MIYAVRGGHWYHSAAFGRGAFRSTGSPTLRFNTLGFRVAQTIDAPTTPVGGMKYTTRDVARASMGLDGAGAPNLFLMRTDRLEAELQSLLSPTEH